MPKNKKKLKKNCNKQELINSILGSFSNLPDQSFNYKQIAKHLGVKDSSIKNLITKVLYELKSSGHLEEVYTGKFKLKSKAGYITGQIEITKNGSAFVVSDKLQDDVFISERNLHQALHGDIVKVYLFAKRRKSLIEGEVVKILKRARESFVGIVHLSDKFAFLIPKSSVMPYDLFIPLKSLNGAEHGQVAIARITDWPDGVKNPFGEIIEVIGNAGVSETEIHAILAEFELPYKFSEDVECEADAIPDTIPKEEYNKRKDFRGVPTFTIDPEDAKDFDDALSLKKLENGNWEAGIHIADVSYYVHPKTLLDDEAYERATSVYLVDRVVPMLPEKLSNQVCSLRPGEEKLCYSAVFEMDNEANVLNEWFGRTIILSNNRFTYGEAQKIIEGGESPLKEEILTFHRLAQVLRKTRFKKGAIAFEKTEVRFKIDEHGIPLGVFYKEYQESNELIEEFMLLANKKVAEFVSNKKEGKKAKTFVYRVHDKPNQDKLESFSKFVKKFGYQLKTTSKNQISASMNALLKAVQDKNEKNIVETLAVRAMAKAEYSTENIGHYGLSFTYYTHFTSPIRRYPDIMVHRLLTHYMNNGESKSKSKYEKRCEHASEMERKAANAERASIKYKQVEFLSNKIGKQFNGIISGVTDWGIYVEIIENKCEGMVPIRDLTDDFYVFDEDNYRLIGRHTQKLYQLGDPLKIEVARANIEKKQLDFRIVEELT